MDSFVAEHLKGVSRTYAIVVPMLPECLADAVGLAYLVFRIIDTIEDAPELDGVHRRALLALVDQALAGDAGAGAALSQPLGETPAERALAAVSDEVFRRVGLLQDVPRAALVHSACTMTTGVRRLLDLAESRSRPYPAVQDQAELREYCYYVAGTVGEMLCAMFAAHLQMPQLTNLRPLAIELGVGLQLVNILKDFRDDAAHGRRYLPLDDGHANAAGAYRASLTAAQASLRRGVEFVLALPLHALGVRRFCGLPIAWGALTLGAARGAAGKMTRAALQDSIRAFEDRVGNDAALAAWLGELLSRVGGGTSVADAGGRQLA